MSHCEVMPPIEFNTYVVRSIEEQEYSDLVSIKRFFVESDFSTLNLTLDFLVEFRFSRSIFRLDFRIRLPSRFGTGGFDFSIHFSKSIITFWSLLLIAVTFRSLFGHFFDTFDNFRDFSYSLKLVFEFWRPEK